MNARHPVTHINLLERRTFSLSVGAMLGLALGSTLLGLFLYGRTVMPPAWEASRRNDQMAAQIREAQGRLTAITGEQTRNARAVGLRQEIDALQPEAQAARALAAAVRGAEGGRAEDMGRALTAAVGTVESGLWLTGVTVDKGGKGMEIQGQAASGASVLRYARRTNEELDRMALRLDRLEMLPANSAGSVPGAPPATGSVLFKLN